MKDSPELPPEFDFAARLKEMRLHTDTATVVTLAARVEDWLEAAIQTKMREDLSARLRERLFQGYGPLASFSGKIDIAYSFSMFNAEIYSDLRAIKDIRNRFAHSKEVLHFESPELTPLLQKLSGWTKTERPIELYMSRCKECVESFKKDLSAAAMIAALRTVAAQHAASQDKSG